MFELLDNVQIVLLFLPRVFDLILQLSTFFLFTGKLSFSNLQIDFQDALFTCHVLVHLMDLIQILFKVLCFLLKLEVVARNAIL